MQEAFDDVGASSSQVHLEIVDEVVTLFPDLLLDEILDARDQDILVMGAIKHTKHSGFRQSLLDAPKEVMSEFLLRRGFEAVMVDALRVDHRDNMSYHSAFAGSVQPL